MAWAKGRAVGVVLSKHGESSVTHCEHIVAWHGMTTPPVSLAVDPKVGCSAGRRGLKEDRRQQCASQPSMQWWWGSIAGALSLSSFALARAAATFRFLSMNAHRPREWAPRVESNGGGAGAVSGRVREETTASNLIECKPVGSQATKEKRCKKKRSNRLLLFTAYPFGARPFLSRFSS